MKSKNLKILLAIVFTFMLLNVSNSFSTTITVMEGNFMFTPAGISATVGDTISWVFVSGSHTTTCNGIAGTSRPPGAAAWSAPINSGTPNFKYVITVAGSYTYICSIHTFMIGTITASAPAITLNLTSLIEGFWNGTTMVGDTVKVFLNNSTTPFSKVDSAKVKLNSSGAGSLSFTHAAGGSYYIVVTHRNSIQTWSKLPQTFTSGGTVSYDFTTAATQAFGNNLVLKSGKYAIYSGDVDQEGNVNLNDIIAVFNDASNFVTGYVKTDVNGDNSTNLADIIITYNNASNFVTVIKPTTLFY